MRRLLSPFASLITLLTFASPAFAQVPVTFTGPECGDVPFCDLGKLLSNILALLFFFSALLAFLFIIIGGIQWITAGGDKVAAQSARDRITAAVIGLIIVVAAFAITLILGRVLGIDLFNYQFPAAENTVGT